jgi:hypothetical protein
VPNPPSPRTLKKILRLPVCCLQTTGSPHAPTLVRKVENTYKNSQHGRGRLVPNVTIRTIIKEHDVRSTNAEVCRRSRHHTLPVARQSWAALGRVYTERTPISGADVEPLRRCRVGRVTHSPPTGQRAPTLHVTDVWRPPLPVHSSRRGWRPGDSGHHACDASFGLWPLRRGTTAPATCM